MSTDVSTSSRLLSVITTNTAPDRETKYEDTIPIAKTSPSTPPPPPPHAFSSLPLLPGAVLSSSHSRVGTTSSSRIYEQSKNLGYVPSLKNQARSAIQENDSSTLLPHLPGAVLSTSQPITGTTNSKRVHALSKNLASIPTLESQGPPSMPKHDSAAINFDTSVLDLDKDGYNGNVISNTAPSLPLPNMSNYPDTEQKDTDLLNAGTNVVQSAHRIDSQLIRPDMKEPSCIEDVGRVAENTYLLSSYSQESMENETEQPATTTFNLLQQRVEQKDGIKPPSMTLPHTAPEVDRNISCEPSQDSDGTASISSVPQSPKPSIIVCSNLSNEHLVHKQYGNVNHITSSGASSPSLLSSKEDSIDGKDLEEVKRREETRMNHLSLLLDLHRQNEKRKTSNLNRVKKNKKKGVGESTGDVEKANKKNKKNKKKHNQSQDLKLDEGGYRTDSTWTSIKLASPSIGSDGIQRSFNPTSLFENFERNWTSHHPSSSNRERMCFASVVTILLNDNAGFPLSSSQSSNQATRSDKVAQRGESFSNRSDVPLQVVKLFWKKTILPSLGLPMDDADVVIENIIESLFQKLRYLVLVPASSVSSSRLPRIDKHSLDSQTVVHLSHEVYGEYAKYIMNYDDNIRQQVDEWRSSFTIILENIFVSGIKESVPIDIRRYAAVSLPLHILSLCKPVDTTALSRMLMQERRREYTAKFVTIMTNSHFLSWRMVVFGDGMRIGGLISDEYNGKKKKMRRKITNSHFVRNRWNILKASSHHVRDLEHFISALYATNGDVKVTLDPTTDILSMYHAWQMECLEVLKIAKKRLSVDDDEHVFGRKNEKQGKIMTPPPTKVTGLINKNVDPGSSASPTFLLNESREKSSHIPRSVQMKRNKKSKDLAYVRYMTSSADGLPAQFQPFSGEYTIDATRNLISLKKVTFVRDPQSGMRPLPRVRVLHNSSRMISKSPVMRLFDVLAIDLRVLYLQVTLGKVMNIISQSISEASSMNSCVNKTESTKIAPGPLLAITKVKYTAESIKIYSRTMNVMSFLLSEDLGQVDEEDLTDLGYHDNGRGSLSLRIKKLKNDRVEAIGLIGQLRILCAESWYDIGKILCHGAKAGRSTAVEMAKISILSLPLDPSYADDGQQYHDKRGGCDEPEKLQNKVLHCYQFSLSLLRQNSKTGGNAENGSLSSRSRSCDDTTDNANIGCYKRTLLASIIHSIGIHYYAQVGNLETAKLCLYEALSRRRLLLRQLQKDVDDVTSASGSSMNGASNQNRRRSLDHSIILKSFHTDRKIHNREGLSQNDLLFASGLSKKEQIDRMELDLSHTLEFAALTSHSHLDHQTSISFFQEAIILRALHAGKNSLDVARLHYNMGVIHDDLGQHEASLSRYGKSLKVRLSHVDRFNLSNDCSRSESLQHSTALADIDDLEATVVLTLRCMGNVYRALNDATHALSCYMKAIELLKSKLKRLATELSFGIYQDSSDCELGFGKGIGSKAMDLPIPGSHVDEMQEHDNYIKPIPIFGLLGSETIAADAQPFENINSALSENDKIRKDIANMYSTIVSLVNDRKQQYASSTVGSTRSGYLSAGGYSSGGYGSVSSGHSHSRRSGSNFSKQSQAPDENKLNGDSSDDVILLNAAFNLGMVTMHFGEYQNAMCYFEEAFRTIWTSMGNGEASDSDISSKESSRDSTRPSVTSSTGTPLKPVVEGQVEEGIVYHAMAVAHAALSEHERAVRCFLTALRYYRRRLGMNSLKVAGALYDCGSSYWHLGDYIKAEEFWADCFRIVFREGNSIFKETSILSTDANTNLSVAKKNGLNAGKVIEQDVQVGDAEYARILHNLGNVHLQNGHLDVASQCYEEALAMRRKLLNMGVNGHTVLTKLCDAHANRAINHEKLRDMANTLHNLGWLYEMQTMYEKALTCLNQALFIKQSLSNQKETQSKQSNDENSLSIVLSRDEMNLGKTLSCAVTLLRIGSVHAKIYNHDVGLSYYRAALSIQRSELGNDHIAVARTLFDMGQIANHHTDASGLNKDAMTCFNEALRIAKLQFGQHHYAVAGVMYDIGSIHDKSGNDLDAIAYYRSSVKVYGRIYATSLLKRFCFIPVFRTVGSVSSVNYEGFNPAGLGDQYSIENRARSSAQQAAAIEDGKDRELFIRASIAMTAVAERSGVINEYTLLGFELSFWKFVEGLAASGMESIRARVRSFLLAFVNHFEQVNSNQEPKVTPHQKMSDSFLQTVWK